MDREPPATPGRSVQVPQELDKALAAAAKVLVVELWRI